MLRQSARHGRAPHIAFLFTIMLSVFALVFTLPSVASARTGVDSGSQSGQTGQTGQNGDQVAGETAGQQTPGTLPATGGLPIPVSALALTGLALAGAGWIVRRRQGTDRLS